MSVCNNHSAYFLSVGKIILLGEQFWAMDRFDLLGGQNNFLGGQSPTQVNLLFTSLIYYCDIRAGFIPETDLMRNESWFTRFLYRGPLGFYLRRKGVMSTIDEGGMNLFHLAADASVKGISPFVFVIS